MESELKHGFPNLRHLGVFLEVIETSSITKAAQNCNLSQSAATQALKQLEKDINAKLLSRGTSGFEPTPLGRRFAKRAALALGHLDGGARHFWPTPRRASTGGAHRFNWPMTAAQLRSLIAISNTGNISLAAQELGLSQPTVSRSIQALEEATQTPLILNRASGVRLSDAAEHLVKAAKLARGELRQGQEEINHAKGGDNGTFVLGSLPLARAQIVPHAIHKMIQDFPSVQIRIVEGRYNELLKSLREGDIDCLFGALRPNLAAPDVIQTPIFQDKLTIIAHPTHPLAKHPSVSLAQTLRYPWIAPPKDTPSGQHLFHSLKIDQLEQTPVRIVSSSMAVLRSILSQGDYISIVSRHQINLEIQLGQICVLNVDLDDNERAIGLTRRKDWHPTEIQSRFIQFLHSCSTDLLDHALTDQHVP